MLVASIVLFDKIRVSDILFAVLTGFILVQKIKAIKKIKKAEVVK